MFVPLNAEKKSRQILSDYFLEILKKNLNIDPVDPDFVLLYFTLKSQFYSRFRRDKFVLKSFFTLISLEYKRYNTLRLSQFKHSYKYHVDFKKLPDAIPEHYIRYLKRNLNFILDFAMTNVYNFFLKLFLGLTDMFPEGQYRSRRKIQKSNKNIGFLVNNTEVVYDNMINNIKCTHSFNYFVYSLKIFALRKLYYSSKSYKVKILSNNPFFSNFLEFITVFEHNTLQYSKSSMVDYVNYKPNELTVFDFDYNKMLNSRCSEFFNKIEYSNLKFLNTDFWFYLVNGRINLYSKFREYLMRELTEKTIKLRITKKHKKKYLKYIEKLYLDRGRISINRVLFSLKKNKSYSFNINEVNENYINPNNLKLNFNENYKYNFNFDLKKNDYDRDLSMHLIKSRVLELFRVNLNNNT
jgi:hypothetical protein